MFDHHSHKARRKNTGVRHALCLTLFLAGSFLALPALSSDRPGAAQRSPQDTAARLNRLENELQTLSRAVFRGETPPPGTALPGSGYGDTAAQAAMQVRLQQLEGEIRDLTGQIEQQSFEIRRFTEDMQRAMATMESRLITLEGGSVQPQYGGLGTSGTGPVGSGSLLGQTSIHSPVSSGQRQIQTHPPYNNEEYVYDGDSAEAPRLTGFEAGMPAQPQPLPGQQLGSLRQDSATGALSVPPLSEDAGPSAYYERAFSLLRDKNFPAAQDGFEDFLNRFPEHNLASNAKYWLGETYYVRNDFERAARIFAETYQQYPKGSKGPDSLLKLGMALAGMGKKDDACLSFSQLMREYEGVASPVLDRGRSEMDNIGCN